MKETMLVERMLLHIKSESDAVGLYPKSQGAEIISAVQKLSGVRELFADNLQGD
jgi:hypothetical protein